MSCLVEIDQYGESAYHGAAEFRFKASVKYLWEHGVYPGPTALNNYLHRRGSDKINGRECRWRREVMRELGIPLKRPRLSYLASTMPQYVGDVVSTKEFHQSG